MKNYTARMLKNDMEVWITKIASGLITASFIFGIVRFLLRYYVNRIDHDIKEIKDNIKSEVEAGNKIFDTVFKRIDKNRDKMDELVKSIENLKGYIDGRESK